MRPVFAVPISMITGRPASLVRVAPPHSATLTLLRIAAQAWSRHSRAGGWNRPATVDFRYLPDIIRRAADGAPRPRRNFLSGFTHIVLSIMIRRTEPWPDLAIVPSQPLPRSNRRFNLYRICGCD